jgi:two-component system, sensor histidine kinase PdtaS
LFYASKKDLLEFCVPYFKEGLQKNESCTWILPDSLSAEEAAAAIGGKMPDLEGYIKNGQLEFSDYSDVYLRSGEFNPEAILNSWAEKEKQVLSRGFSGLRVSGDASWFRKVNWEDLINYEKEAELKIPGTTITALCTYPLEQLDISEIYLLSNVHRRALSNRNGLLHPFK